MAALPRLGSARKVCDKLSLGLKRFAGNLGYFTRHSASVSGCLDIGDSELSTLVAWASAATTGAELIGPGAAGGAVEEGEASHH